ncbi:DNA-directed RNA polymerase subunit beta [Desulfocurvibacter africanus]|uniref:DNA-directed RNA polymerase subunit beta n=1 Tax=Desulfocurvibacter africanus subsp. africanus str. Walvis Bay TaxID=690850 RepID=F3YTX4_DESAF|nr:DNA-directed RNA polymerase subunit beta [Desulfocurvibacter africanus]EGJ48580.1 DNA-directed RNA polymerase subunit beta [Desulfocurvibacter africanus subsp. africanus str. Walvis Bay]
MGQLAKQFGKISYALSIPHLLNLQIDSYMQFLQMDVPPASREDYGLEGVFRSVFPIEDFNKTASLDYVSYEIGEPKFDQVECISKGLTYEAPIRIKVRLVVYDVDEESGNRTIRDIKEQDIYFGTIPLMTEKGTFIINGTERVIVNQLQRSPGIIFEHDSGKTHSSKRVLYSCRVIPMRGSWLDFDYDHKDILYVRIDRRRKMPATILFKAMGLTKQDILDYFYERETYRLDGERVFLQFDPKSYRKDNAFADIVDAKGEVIAKAGKPITKRHWRLIGEAGVKEFEIDPNLLFGLFLATDIVDTETGEVIGEAGEEIHLDMLENLRRSSLSTFQALYTRGADVSSSLRDTLMLDKTDNLEQAQVEIYRRLRPSSPPTPEIAASFFENLFRNADYYDLSPVGRYKLNARLSLDRPLDERTLSNEDILSAIKQLAFLKDTHGPADDIDHLGNRRVRPVGELVENQYRIGLVRMERAIKERMSLQEVATLMPHDLINPKPVAAVLKEFFGTSQLSQFMDQTNPLSEVTHKRRLSALGPGGLTRERAGFEVRDVHTSHYGRICPIETPEGPNIGLIVSLTTLSRVNDYGFIETPYRVIRNAQVTDEIHYLDASREADHVIAQANAPLDESRSFAEPLVTARIKGDVFMAPREDITLMDISPGQIVSISAALIPFLEHDDANRALMGSNMQRQAVPLISTEKPLVGTGMEGTVARDSGACLLAEHDGVVSYADADRVVVVYDGEVFPESGGVRSYELQKYHKSNQNSSFGQKPRVHPGQVVKKGAVLADGPGIQDGDLALGKNLLVAFMPWCGYNYEDSILISERVVKEDVFTSVHIEEFELVARDTKLGPEEVTRDIPNVGEEMLRNLDESGIIRIGAKIAPDDILVGKITPKGETQLTPEEKLLRAIFGDKARDVKNTSLKVPPGIEGTIIDVKVFNRRSSDKDERTKLIEDYELHKLDRMETQHIQGLNEATIRRIWGVAENNRVNQTIMGKKKGEVLLEENKSLTMEVLEQLPLKKLAGMFVSRDTNESVKQILDDYERQVRFIRNVYERKKTKVTEGDDLPPGVIKMVKVYIAVKRKLSVGDKMAGRHGNKGVVSNILPAEDMPFFADGTPMDIVLNPLGVPSRMNIGQIMETHLGWAAKELGKQLAELVDSGAADEVLRQQAKEIFTDMGELIDAMDSEELKASLQEIRNGFVCKTPVFDGASEDDIWGLLKKAGLPDDGKSVLFDGRTGDMLHNRVTVGVMYMLKLHHLVDEKIHARSTGPYSLVTQQPLGGKAQFGGQRLGEMEVWALEAYGAANLLQEFLTVKSDDVTGRVKMYEKIVKGENFLESGLPESFNVLVKELMSLGLDVTLIPEERKRVGKNRAPER